MLGSYCSIRGNVLAVEKAFSALAKNTSSFSTITSTTVAANPLALDWAVELQHVSVPVRLSERAVWVELNISDLGPSRHEILLSVNDRFMSSFLLCLSDAR